MDKITLQKNIGQRSVGIVETEFYTFAESPNELILESGVKFGPITLAYETYGTLNAEKSNAILICHTLTSDANAAGFYKGSTKPGWWDGMIGPGKAFDTNKYFVISSNVFGSCKGSTGPASINSKTSKPYGLSFPVVTIKDMVVAQKKLIEHLGIKKLFSVAGGSMGGLQALKWSILYPDCVNSVVVVATNYRHTAQQIALHEVCRQAIMSDPDWKDGDYYGKSIPARGLALSRMIGHITYMSEKSMDEKFGRKLIGKERVGFDFSHDFEVESYLKYRGDSFVQRFDANTYLYLTKSLDYFDLSEGKDLISTFKNAQASFLVISFTSDWLYPSYQSQEMVRALKANDLDVSDCEIDCSYGHDAFLVEIDAQSRLISDFLSRLNKEKINGELIIANQDSKSQIRFDHQIILDLVKENSRVLDLGCGNGDLLALLINRKKVQGTGIEIDEQAIYKCMEKGLTVSHGDIDSGLLDYSSKRFDYVILNESLQEVLNPEKVILEALRVGKQVIVGIPNFCHIKARLQIFLRGKVPVTSELPYEWYNTPNLRFLSLKDFHKFCERKDITIDQQRALSGRREINFLPNIFAHTGLYLLHKD